MDQITRRELLKKAAAAGGAMLLAAKAGAEPAGHSSNPSGTSNEGDGGSNAGKIKSLGPVNADLDSENMNSVVPPTTDHGNIDPFKYPFDFAHKKVSSAGWARQVTVRDLRMAKDLAGVNMRLAPNGCRELHWHESAEWAYMIAGKARITCIDYEGKPYVDDVGPGDLWYFPSGIPHSIQAPNDAEGCEFLLVFDDGSFSEYETFLISEWVARTPKNVLARNFNVPESALQNLPKEEQFIFTALPFKPLEEERKQAAGNLGYSKVKFTFHVEGLKPTLQNNSGEVLITDSKTFAISTTVANATVTLKPGGIRELHWHPNADEWQYYVQGKGRMSIFDAGNRNRTMDVQAGDVGYVPITAGHYIENTGTEDLIFLEIFKSSFYTDLSLNEWITHTPEELVKSHLKIDQATYDAIRKDKEVVLAAR